MPRQNFMGEIESISTIWSKDRSSSVRHLAEDEAVKNGKEPEDAKDYYPTKKWKVEVACLQERQRGDYLVFEYEGYKNGEQEKSTYLEVDSFSNGVATASVVNEWITRRWLNEKQFKDLVGIKVFWVSDLNEIKEINNFSGLEGFGILKIIIKYRCCISSDIFLYK